MRLRIATLSELQFLRCLQYEVWGSGSSVGLRRWKKGDMLAFVVDKKIAGLAEVVGEPYRSEEEIWENGLFPERIAVKFRWVLDEVGRSSTQGRVQDILVRAWGPHYGWGIVSKQVLPEDAAKTIAEMVMSMPDASAVFRRDIKQRIKQAMKAG